MVNGAKLNICPSAGRHIDEIVRAIALFETAPGATAKMAARTKGKPKQASGARSPPKTAAERASATAKSPRTKAATAKKATKAKPAAVLRDTETALLREQNEALRAELEQAQARIAHLEDVNSNVVNRIDWVIDSLQSVLKR